MHEQNKASVDVEAVQRLGRQGSSRLSSTDGDDKLLQRATMAFPVLCLLTICTAVLARMNLDITYPFESKDPCQPCKCIANELEHCPSFIDAVTLSFDLSNRGIKRLRAGAFDGELELKNHNFSR
jgi:hypothetical protein